MPIKLLINTVLFLNILNTESYAMQINEPEYYVKLNMQNCPRIIDINGIVIERNMKGHSSNAEYPINHWIKNGENTISFHYGPEDFVKSLTDDNSVCNAAVWVKGTAEDQAINYKIVDLDYLPDYEIDISLRHKNSMPSGHYAFSDNNSVIPSDNNSDFHIGDIQIGNGEFESVAGRVYRTFTATVPFPEWGFFTGDKISFYPYDKSLYKSMKNELWPMVLEYWDMFESQEIDKLIPLFEERSKELDIAYYREPGYSIKSFENDLRNIYKANYPLNRKESKQMKLVVSYNEQLVTIVNAANQIGTVMFYDKDSDSNTFFDIVWMKKDGKWIVAR